MPAPGVRQEAAWEGSRMLGRVVGQGLGMAPSVVVLVGWVECLG